MNTQPSDDKGPTANMWVGVILTVIVFLGLLMSIVFLQHHT